MSRQTGDFLSSDQQDAWPSLIHDLRHAMFALKTGITLLPQLRDNAEQFNELCEALEEESKRASELLQKLVERADTMAE